eukprot:UC4_evm9s507
MADATATNATTTTTTTTPSNPTSPTHAPAGADGNTPSSPTTLETQSFSPQQLSLYVGDLAPDCTEAQLFEKFSTAGPVASIRVCRDATTRRSLGYAYVNYNNPEHNLDKTINDRELYDTFAAFGDIVSSKVVKDSNTGESLGYAFVHYSTEEAANSAIEKVNGMLLKDMKVYVGKFVPRKAAAGSAQRQFTNVFVKNLPDSINSDEKLRELFAPFGETLSVKLMMMEPTSENEEVKSKGSGFVNFKEPDDAAKAVEDMNGKEVDGMQIYASRAQKRAERQNLLKKEHEKRKLELQSKFKGVNLYVKNLSEDITEEKLQAAFAEYGSCKVVKDPKTNIPRGFGFVCFSNPDEATKAVTEMNGKIDVSRGISKPLYVALAERKEERHARLEGQYHSRLSQQQQISQGGMIYPGQPGIPMGYPMPGMPMHQNRFYQSRPRFQQSVYQNGNMNMIGQYGVEPRPKHTGQSKPIRNANMYQAPLQATNMVQPQTQVQVPQQQPQTASSSTGINLSPSKLASLSESEQKQMLGESLYPSIQKLQPELAGKITGMLLEMDNSELLHLIEDVPALQSKVQEAVQVLKQHKNTKGKKKLILLKEI